MLALPATANWVEVIPERPPPPEPQSEPVPESTPDVLAWTHCVEPVMLVVKFPEIVGVVSVGDVAKTAKPDPVSLVSAAARFALVGVVRKV